jgi:hypothetical protein
MSRTRFGVTRHTPNSVKGLMRLPAIKLVLAFEAAALLLVFTAARG